MIRVFVERSGEAPELARAETVAAAEALGGRAGTPGPEGPTALVEVELPDPSGARALAARLGLARRCLVPIGDGEERALEALEHAATPGRSAAVRRFGHPSGGGTDAGVEQAGARLRARGVRIDLEQPDHRLWIVGDEGSVERLFEEVSAVDRPAFGRRRMPQLPFQRPVSLAPRLARAAANLARVRPGDPVLDPFVGTGALLAEAGLLGGRLFGIDRDPTMVRGALRNFEHLRVAPEELVVGDAGEVQIGDAVGAFAAVLTDPPYGRASGTGGEEAGGVVARVLPRWAERVAPGGRVVVVLPGGPDPLPPPWRRVVSVPVRVHRSLTREFRVYERAA